jgi:sugar phosphate isomerase/epimerase
MQLGIFSKTFVRDTSGEALDAVAAHGLTCVQFNFETAGLADMPDRFDPDLCRRIREELTARDLSMAAVSGTFNMIHPNEEERAAGMRRLRALAETCADLGTAVITLCSGTRSERSMWQAHPDNAEPDAWRDLLAAMEEAVDIAEGEGVILAFEPEVSNVADSARKSRRLLDEIGSQSLKVVMDGANIFHQGELPRMTDILREAFDLLGDSVALAHAKDLDRDGEAGHLAAGTGLLDYDLYLSLLGNLTDEIPLILHGLEEQQVSESVAFVRSRLGDG